MGTTSNESLRYPGLTDDVDVPGDIENLAEDTDTRLFLRKGRGLMATKASTSTVGTTTTATTELVDSVLGNYVFTSVASRVYRITITGRFGCASGQTVPGLFEVKVRDGGASTPTSASTLVLGGKNLILSIAGGTGQYDFVFTQLWTPSAGTHTLGLTLQRTSGTAVAFFAASLRELYVEDIGS